MKAPTDQPSLSENDDVPSKHRLDSLPLDIKFEILGHLSLRSFIAIMSTCHSFYDLYRLDLARGLLMTVLMNDAHKALSYTRYRDQSSELDLMPDPVKLCLIYNAKKHNQELDNEAEEKMIAEEEPEEISGPWDLIALDGSRADRHFHHGYKIALESHQIALEDLFTIQATATHWSNRFYRRYARCRRLKNRYRTKQVPSPYPIEKVEALIYGLWLSRLASSEQTCHRKFTIYPHPDYDAKIWLRSVLDIVDLRPRYRGSAVKDRHDRLLIKGYLKRRYRRYYYLYNEETGEFYKERREVPSPTIPPFSWAYSEGDGITEFQVLEHNRQYWQTYLDKFSPTQK
ncbi:hypothetical protein ABW20_dc0104973 [Dactylellina cionopaga]|nr:hypothetical protein ABW20_dc0104973 [Dactylellina cionopaga]